MNAVRRKALLEIIGGIERLRSDLEDLMQEEEEYRDNMPENLQGSERYERADEAVTAMEDAVSNLSDAIDNIDSARE